MEQPEEVVKKLVELMGFTDFRVEVKPERKRASVFIYNSEALIKEKSRVVEYLRAEGFAVLNFDPLIAEMNKGAFPSGHAAFYFALILPVFLIDKRLGQYLTGAVLLMGIARVFVGVHWPADILAGAAVAVVSFYFVRHLLDR